MKQNTQPPSGALIAFEGIDQSGKATQANRALRWLMNTDRLTALLSFPRYHTPTGHLIRRALTGDLDYDAETVQLLNAANRREALPLLKRYRQEGRIVLCDRYTGSGIAYGSALGLSRRWLEQINAGLPAADKTILLDIDPTDAVARKSDQRDFYEKNTELLVRAAREYRRTAAREHWTVIDGRQSPDAVEEEVRNAIEQLVGPPPHGA